jgi:hypothetical protein
LLFALALNADTEKATKNQQIWVINLQCENWS